MNLEKPPSTKRLTVLEGKKKMKKQMIGNRLNSIGTIPKRCPHDLPHYRYFHDPRAAQILLRFFRNH